MKRYLVSILFLIIFFSGAYLLQKKMSAPKGPQDFYLPQTGDLYAIETNFGEMIIRLFNQDAPVTSDNFQLLASKGFYDGTKFHRIIPGFMIQGGDPNTKDSDWSDDGFGGPGYKFEDELNSATASYRKGYARGVVAMANSGPNTNGSQFFIMHQDYPLDHNYMIFGEVIEGIEVVDKIVNLPRNSNDHPLKDAVILKIRSL